MRFRRSKRQPARGASRAGRIHLVRHGEVSNPDHVVYAGLDGFHLSSNGKRQAAETANRLGELNVAGVVSSPLDRAVETAQAIAALHGLQVTTDERLTEWALATRWEGIVWEDLPSRFPGELEAYLDNPADLRFAPETLAQVAARVSQAIDDLLADLPDGDMVVVGHQDPLHATRLAMTGRSFERFNDSKPGHGSVTTLVSSIGSDSSNDPDWVEATYWEPAQSEAFPPV